MTTYATAQAKKPSGCAIGEHVWDPNDDRCMRCNKSGLQVRQERSVAPASLAAEQRPFRVGDLVTAQGCTFQGLTSGCGMLTGELTSLDASANGHPDLAAIRGTLCLRSTLRHAEPPPAKRPECDACGKESVFTFTQPGLSAVAAKGGAVHLCHRCGDEIADDEAARMIRERRKQLASDSRNARHCDKCMKPAAHTGLCAEHAVGHEEPGRPSRDPYRPQGQTDEGMRIHETLMLKDQLAYDAARLAAMKPKDRQAAEMLLRPARTKVYRPAPASWPDDAWMDAGSCDP